MPTITPFQHELQELINRHSMEGKSNTPDFILALYLRDCLELFSRTVTARDNWYGLEAQSGAKETKT